MDKLIKYEVEDLQINEGQNGTKTLKLPELTEEEINIVDPMVAPTSGLRIQIYDIHDEEHYFLTKRKLFLFLRVAKAISEKFKEIKNHQNLKVLLVSDNRPSKDILLTFAFVQNFFL